MAEFYWLKRPIAHRGLHDQAKGIIENSASAVRAAMGAGYAVEVDLQCCAGHMPIVFHDATLDRLTGETGDVATRDAEALCSLPLRGSEDRILSLPALLALVNGRVPLLLEVKSTWTREGKYEANITLLLASYPGPVAVMSFDPHCVALPAARSGRRALRRSELLVATVVRPALRHAELAHLGLRTAPLHRLRYYGATGGRAARGPECVRAAAAHLDGSHQGRTGSRAALC